MVRYHEGGRFCEKDADWDRESAIFHLEHAADLGELEAIVGLGLLYSQLPHHILADVALKVRGWGPRRPHQPTFPILGSDHWVEPGSSKLEWVSVLGDRAAGDSPISRQGQQG